MRTQAVVTGASTGLGAELAERLARHGYDLVLVARRQQQLEETAARCTRAGAQATVLALDLTAPGGPEKLLERAPDAELVVNGAGFGKIGEALAGDLADYERMIAINVRVLTAITHLYALRMRARGRGTIFNVASSAGIQPVPNAAVYAATKAYVKNYSEALAYELHGSGVSVLTFCPGPFHSEFAATAGVPDHVVERSAAVMMTASQVADEALEAILHKRETYVPGALNRIAAVAARVGPPKIVRAVAARLFKG
jgi:short-subunit dehydrogenase